MKTKVRLDRLKELIKCLEAVPAKKFHMGFWQIKDYLKKPADCEVPKEFVEVDCRTVACSIGWASYYKPFRRQGLKMTENGDIALIKNGVTTHVGGLACATVFFGIDIVEADAIFCSSYASDDGARIKLKDITRRQVIEKLRELINKHS